MKVYACYFGSGRFEAMARALRASLRENDPTVEAVIERVETPARLDSFGANTAKLEHWRARVDGLSDGERLVLLDGDTIVLRPLAPAFGLFALPVALTSKGPLISRMQYNCGVVFVRGGAEASAFFGRWVEVNARLLANRGEHAPYEQRHGGVNQAAWGCMRESKDVLCDLVSALPCADWNACYPPLWHGAAQRAHVVHYKSDLRTSIWTHGPRYADLVALWRKYEAASRKDTP